MSATLDTLKLAKRFRAAGVPEPHAEVFAEALREAGDTTLAGLATKADIAETRGELTLVKWMVGTVIVLVLAVFWQLFAIRSEMTDIKAQGARLETRVEALGKGP